MEIVIPNLGDIDEVEVIELCVAVGDELAENDAVVVIESDKASMEVPSPAAGVLSALQVELGDMVREGSVIGVLQAGAEASAAAQPDNAEKNVEASAKTQESSAPEPQQAPSPVPEPAPAANRELDVLVPDIGDAAEVVVIEIAVQPGDELAVNDLLVVLESDKASMEIAAEHAGTVLQVAVSEGQEVAQGSLIATMRVASDTAEPVVAAKPEQSKPAAAASVEPSAPVAEIRSTSQTADAAADVVAAAKVYAGPATRRLARELGVELAGVQGTGNRGRITKEDVKAYVKQQLVGGGAGPRETAAGWPHVALQDFAKYGPVEEIALSRIRVRGADNLHRSWVNLPHVTQHDETDVTDLEAFRSALKAEAEQRGVKVTPLSFLVKACCHGLQTYPEFNASLAADGKHLVLKQYINIGIAVDTPEGLVVPVIKDAEQKNIWQLSAEIAELSQKARDKKLGMDDLQGGTFSISSLGALGGTGFTPIVNAPEVAILGVAKLQTKPVWDGQAFQPRKMLPLSLSYDHRVINGAAGGRFMQLLTSVLADIRRLAL